MKELLGKTTIPIVQDRSQKTGASIQNAPEVIRRFKDAFYSPGKALSQAAGVFLFLAKIAKDAKIYNN